MPILLVFQRSKLIRGSQRAGMQGTAYTYFTTENARSARELIKILREANSDVPYELEEMAHIGGGGSGGGGRGKGYQLRNAGYLSNRMMQGSLVEVPEVEAEASGPEVVALEVALVGLMVATTVVVAISITGK